MVVQKRSRGLQNSSALDLGYYLWREGKQPGKREFARHHTSTQPFIDGYPFAKTAELLM